MATPSLPAVAALLACAVALMLAQRQRNAAMAGAAGIAAALSPSGWVLLPVLLGTAVARRAPGRAMPAFAAACVATLLLVGWSFQVTNIALWHVAPVELRGLCHAIGAGGAAWLAAACSARRLSPGEMNDAALLATLAGPLLLPLGAETLLLAVGLVLAGARPRLPARAANANPLPLRATA